MTAADQPTTEPSGWRLAFMRAGWLREGDVVDLEDVLEKYGDAYNSRARSAQETSGPVSIEGPDSDGEVLLFVGPVAVRVPAGERIALHLPDPAPQPAADTETEARWGVRRPDGLARADRIERGEGA